MRVLPAVTSGFDFQTFADPEAWENALRRQYGKGNSVRLLASYAREWKTAGAGNPHALPGELMDFNEEYELANQCRFWSRIWNFVPRNGTDYTWFVTGHPAGRIAKDPLCEVGCPYAVRGFDYDYVGILWLDDLKWKNGTWKVQPQCVHETAIKDLTREARRESPLGSKHAALRERVAQFYRILFSRALKGAYVWVPDSETREYFLSSIV